MKNLKTVVWKKEAVFGEAYDKDAAGYQILNASEIVVNRVTEKIETNVLTVDKETNTKSTAARVTGKMSLTKPLDASFYQDHLDLIQAGLGLLVQEYDDHIDGLITAVGSSTELTIADGAFVVAGDLVAISGKKGAYNQVKSVAANVITLRYPLSVTTQALIVENTDTLVLLPKIAPAKLLTDTFKFVCIYDDDSVEVLTGAVPSMSMELPKEGKIDVKIEILSATIGSHDALDVAYVKPTTTLVTESEYPTFYVDFKQTYIYDSATADDKKVCPYMFALKIEHSIEIEKSVCGINGVNGYYVKPSIPAAQFDISKTPENALTFSNKNQDNDNQFIFMSQENFAIYAEKARFSGIDLAYTEEFDNFKLDVDLNHRAYFDLFLALPY